MRNLRGFNSGGKKNEELKEEMLKNDIIANIHIRIKIASIL